MIPLILISYFASFMALVKAAPMPMEPYKSGWYSGSGSNHPTHSQHENAPPTHANEYQGNQHNTYNPDSNVYAKPPYYPPINLMDEFYNSQYYADQGYTNPELTTQHQHNQDVVNPTGRNNDIIDLASLPAYDPYADSPDFENVDYGDFQELMREQSAERQRSSSSHGEGRHRKGKEPAAQSKEKTSLLGRLIGGGKKKHIPSESTPQPERSKHSWDVPDDIDDEENDEVTSYQRFGPDDEPDKLIWNSINMTRRRRLSGVLIKKGKWKSKDERIKGYPLLTERIARQVESKNDEVIQDAISMLQTLVAEEEERKESEKQNKRQARRDNVDYTGEMERKSWDLGSINTNKRLIKTIGFISGQQSCTTYKHLKKHNVTPETGWAILNAPTLRDQQQIVKTFSPKAFSKTEDPKGKRVRLIRDDEVSPDAIFVPEETDEAQRYYFNIE